MSARTSRSAFVVGLVGAESTGKTQLAHELQRALSADGIAVALIDESLRSFCHAQARTPRQDEQAAIADLQTRRIDAAAAAGDVVIADTTALMTAVYSEILFGDTTLYPIAEAAHRRCDLTLLTALDLPWVADGLQRDGPQVRAPVDGLVRAALQRAGAAYAVVSGRGDARTASALAAVRRAWRLHLSEDVDAPAQRWHWRCERCGDAACERHLLPRQPLRA